MNRLQPFSNLQLSFHTQDSPKRHNKPCFILLKDTVRGSLYVCMWVCVCVFSQQPAFPTKMWDPCPETNRSESRNFGNLISWLIIFPTGWTLCILEILNNEEIMFLSELDALCHKLNVEMSSNLFISLSLCRKVEQRFHMCDRMAIYFFIAASYSPWWVCGSHDLGPTN